MTDATQIKTGTEQNSDVTTSDADIFAYADDGEYATVFEIDRLSDTLVRVNYYRCEAGLSEHDGEETFSIDSDKTTKEWAIECAEANPEESIKVTREYFE